MLFNYLFITFVHYTMYLMPNLSIQLSTNSYILKHILVSALGEFWSTGFVTS
jgi:hypothetical protein